MKHKNLAPQDSHSPSQERVENLTGNSIPSLKAITYVGMGGLYPSIKIANETDDVRGITQSTIADGVIGYTLCYGFMYNIDTSAWVAGTSLFADPNGDLTHVSGGGPQIAQVLKSDAVQGVISVTCLDTPSAMQITVRDTDSIDLDTIGQIFEANLRLSSDPASSDHEKAKVTIHPGPNHGVHVEYPHVDSTINGILKKEDWDYFNNKVDSVNGKTGNVISLDTDEVPEGITNLYFTILRARNATVVNTLVGNETDQAPSVDSVKSALALKADKAITVTGVDGLTGGGDLSQNQTISMPDVGTQGSYGDEHKTLKISTDEKGRVTNVTVEDIKNVPASSIINTPHGDISATDVQAAIDELDSEKQPLDSSLTSLGTVGNGMLAKVASGTLVAREIKAGSGLITISNGDGIGGDPTINIPTASATTIKPDESNGTGSSNNLARADHVHNIPTDDAVTIGTANTKGTSQSFSRADHVHDHGQHTDPSHHALATTNSHGFMSSADKTLLDNIDTDDVPEGLTNKYFTDARAKTASVINSLGGSETNKAPSVVAVNSALNGKADASSLANYILISEKGANSGVATLDTNGKIPNTQLPPIAITDTFTVADETAMLALIAQTGDVAIRTDISKTFILKGSSPSVLSDWVELATPTAPVLSVNSKVGAVSLNSADIPYNNTISHLSASTVQGAIDELKLMPTSDIYVDALNGDDSGTGGIFSPVKTLYKAIELVDNTRLYTIRLASGHYAANGTNDPIDWLPNVSLIGAGATTIGMQIKYISQANDLAFFSVEGVEGQFYLDFSNADMAMPMFNNGSYSITRVDTMPQGPWFLKINDSYLSGCVFSGITIISNGQFNSDSKITSGGMLLFTDTTIGVNFGVETNSTVILNGCLVVGAIVGIDSNEQPLTDPNDFPIIQTDASSTANAALVSVKVTLSDSSKMVSFNNTGSTLLSTNVEDAIKELENATLPIFIESTNDTSSIDLDVSSGELTAEVKITATQGNVTLSKETDGLKAAVDLSGKEDVTNKSTATDLGDASPSDTLFPTQKAVKTYVDGELANKADASSLADYFKKDGSVKATSDFDMDSNKIINVLDPSNEQDAATKKYVDDQIGAGGSVIAANVSNTPYGNISSTNVQSALEELEDEKQPLHTTLTAITASNTGLLVKRNGQFVTSTEIKAGSGKINITNGDGILGDPTIDIPTATSSSLTPNSNNAEGVANSLARSDHSHYVVTAAPVAQVPGQTNNAGVALSFAKSDHIHEIPTGAAVTINATTTNAEGNAATFARSNHTHSIPTSSATTVTTSTANTTGTSANLARADHTHKVEITNYQAGNSNTINLTSGGMNLMPDMSISNPAAGTYLVVASTYLASSSSGSEIEIAVHVGGTIVELSRRRIEPRVNTASHLMSAATNCVVTVNGSQDIDLRWSRGSGTATAHQRTINIVKLS